MESPVPSIPAPQRAPKLHGLQIRRVRPPIGRNARCPCGSGKKFKACHAVGREPPFWQQFVEDKA